MRFIFHNQSTSLPVSRKLAINRSGLSARADGILSDAVIIS
ncbi:hypothetical protein X793_06985 [Dehalococcoides mccartyi CG4]|nr:hypothetical protein X793_06985 [Dehalococcoides mccartyi CG4]